MDSAAPERVLRYAHASMLSADGRRSDLRLATAAGSGLLFEGRLRHPARSARLLCGVSQVVASRFHVPGSQLVALLDPVVTVGREELRFEGFSACAGVHVLVVFGSEAYDGEVHGVGTTNVDFGEELRATLAGVRDGEALGLRIGSDAVEIDASGGSVVERRVPLPPRWVRSFLEVQALQAELAPGFDVPGTAAVRFLRSLARRGGSGGEAWIARSRGGLRLAARPAADRLRVAGAVRLRVLEGPAHDARSVRFLGGPEADALGVVLDFGDSHLALTLSAEVWRGFSGEGATLTDLAEEDRRLDRRVRAALRFGECVDADRVAATLECRPAEVRASLARLARAGDVGFELGRRAYYRRELSLRPDVTAARTPRLERARALVANGAVARRDGSDGTFDVRGTRVVHRVELRDDGVDRCTCRWYARHAGARGPCAHVLAARLVQEGRP